MALEDCAGIRDAEINDSKQLTRKMYKRGRTEERLGREVLCRTQEESRTVFYH